MSNKSVILTCLIACLFMFALNGCGSDVDDPSEEPANNLPMVRKLSIPDQFVPGETFELQIMAHDPDGDILNYTWHVTAGKLDTTTAATVKWTAPNDVQSVTITVKINDTPTSAITRSKNVTYLSSRPTDPQITRIIPGKRAAGIALGDPFDTVIALYGKQDDPIGQDGFFAYWDNNIGISGFVNDDKTVRSLFIRRPNKAKTDAGTGIGSTRKHVENEFGTAEEIKNRDKDHWYWTKGIQFDYNDAFKVESIYIFEPIEHVHAAPHLNPAQIQKIKQIELERKRRYKTITDSQEN